MAAEPHVIIAGPGRVGATLLMKTYTDLGMYTGYQKGLPIHHTDGCRFEWPLRGARKKLPIPYIIKEPKICTDIDLMVKRNAWHLDHVYILLRSPGPEAAAIAFMEKGKEKGSQTSERDLPRVTRWFSRRITQLIHLLAEMEVDCTLVSYPKFAEDFDYARNKFKFLLDKYNIDGEKFKRTLQAVVDPEEIRYAYERMPERDRTQMKEWVR